MEVDAQLSRLVALSGGRVGRIVRQTCADAIGLPPLPAGAPPDSDPAQPAVDDVVAGFAEQFSVDVTVIDEQQRSALWAALGDNTFAAVVQMYLADYLPRVRAGLQALDLPVRWTDPVQWDHEGDPSDPVFNGLLPAVGRLRALDPVTSEVVRLRGAAQHNCRLCKSLREAAALDAGGSDTLYGDIAGYETSELLSERHKAALRYVDALIWSPARIDSGVAAGVRAQFGDDEAVELTLDVLRNASNKIAVALGADAPRVAEGTERYLIGVDGHTVFG